ncbi:transposase [Noviherbaspirillum denitrificans]|uniref:Transposase n=1 Tax=Noviherbaspirillum denitrificans TaxID=1968433 RepID=A0A254TIC5_9BURK|nr:transposase [Noviherbaspirillum denitrificans]OWW20323.1 transposase [Noviherbaspirillum denitrificans]
MARLPRLVVPNQPHHIIQTGNDRQAIFREAEDYTAFLAWLREAAKQFKVAIHAYVLLPNHVHLLVSPSDDTGMGRMMQWVGRHYVPYYNARYKRTGTLWQGRYRATVIDASQYFLLCSRYIESHPVRAGLVSAAEDYPWSSIAHHIGVRPDPLITDHSVYWALGNTPFDREAGYKALLDLGVSQREADAITQATLKGWPLGSDGFKAALAKKVARRVEPAKRGRPAKLPLSP